MLPDCCDMVYRSGTVVWIRNPKRAFSQTQHMGVSRYPLNSAVGFTYLHQSQPAKRQNQVMITSSIFEFSGRLDTFESDIIMERQRGENWISQVISEALVCRFGDTSGFTPDLFTPTYWIAFQIKKRGLLKSIHALCSIGQSEQ